MPLLRHIAGLSVAGSLLLALAVPVVLLVALPQTAQAAETVGAKVGAPLKAAQDLARAKKFNEALKQVKQAEAISGKTPYETFVVHDFKAYLNAQSGNYGAAAEAYEAALNTGKAPANTRALRIKTIATLYYQGRNFGKAVQYADLYEKETGPDLQMQTLVAQACYQQGNYAGARDAAAALVKGATASGRRPPEGVLQIGMNSAFKLKDQDGYRAALIQLVTYYPSDIYWIDAINQVARKLGTGARASLEVDRLKLARGVLKTSDAYIEMGQLAIQAGLPGEAQALIEKGTASGVLGGANKGRETRLLNMAKSQAAADRPTLSTAAGSAKAMAAKAEAYASYGDTAQAIALYKKALAQGGLEDAGLVQMHLGQALLAADKKSEAAQAFASVKHPSRYADLAYLWALHAR